MNKKQRIIQAHRLLSNKFRVETNSVRINVHNNLEHEVAKLKVAYLLIKDGKKVITEAIFHNGGRADLFVPEDYAIYEILKTEQLQDAINKAKKYPNECEVFYLDTSEVLQDGYEL